MKPNNLSDRPVITIRTKPAPNGLAMVWTTPGTTYQPATGGVGDTGVTSSRLMRSPHAPMTEPPPTLYVPVLSSLEGCATDD
ncbi:hypothetical protein PCANC_26088 [Puccinia coronata f. sp. avenae]|uniref:Uncharacterized protein n=1 Tax=Puccinia coronata f. sp. avenae TaxID=200324 RepID=A0A2N5TJH6_9BASI|nr:hypothetical protein PCANC_26088 [Puccinia coronata f. sp. avenae]